MIVITALYFFSARQTRHCHHRWSKKRLLAFTTGSGLMLIAFSPPMLLWAHHDIHGHMVQHLLLGMFAPLAWVLAAPMTLLLRTVPVNFARPCSRLLRSSAFKLLSHPATATLFNIGGMYVLYLTPLYVNSMHNLALHIFVHVHFVLAGYLYCWSIAGRDAPPYHAPFITRLFVLLLGIAAHSYLAKLMYINLWPSGTFSTTEEIRSAAQIMYYGGDLAEALLAVVLFYGWLEKSKRHHTRNIKKIPQATCLSRINEG